MLFTAYSYGRMVVVQPIAGSAYAYASRAFGRPVGFMVGWALLLDYIFLPMINYLVIGLYMEDYFPSIDQPVWIVLTVLIVTGLNILGIRLLAGMNFVLVGAQFVFIVVFAVLAIGDITGEVEVQSFTAPFVDVRHRRRARSSRAPRSSRSRSSASTRSRRCRRRPTTRARGSRRRSSCARSWAASSTSSSPTSGTSRSPTTQSFEDHQDVASADVMESIGGDFLNSFFTAAYVAGAFACAMASQASVSRILFAMSRDGSLPRPLFARLHRTYRTPVAANLVVGLFGLTALFISLATVSSMISFGALAAFSFVNLVGGQDLHRRPGPAHAARTSSSTACCRSSAWPSRSTCGPSCPGSRSRSASAGWRPGSSRCSSSPAGSSVDPPPMYTGDEEELERA